ncbi:MAG: LysM peptidoglycan-binding domain-containing protein [Trichodesmium sp. MAG_R01]|nr:LysM peptidoglycan-binding domain-containing protein [Trichodesmium sp. MAG_R01]
MLVPEDNSSLTNLGVNLERDCGIIAEIDVNNPLIFTASSELSSVPITQLSNLDDNIIFPQNSPIYEPIVDISADPSVDPVTGESIVQVINSAVVESLQSLRGFAANPEFEAKMDLAFGKNWDKEANISWPAIRVISSAEIDGANGAFAEATQTIYLSQEFLAQNLENIGEVRNVWLEEFGHSIDSQINIVDAQGDEGKIFSAVVQGKDLNEVDIEVLKSENDRAFVEIDGKTLEIEKNNYQWVDYTIQPGDSLSQIALNTTGNASNYWKIADKNGIVNPNEINVGWTISVPSNNSTGANVAVGTGNNDDWEPYRVQPGDSLWAIAQNTTGDPYRYPDIARYNNLDPNAVLPSGVQIWVPSNNSTGTTIEVTTGNYSGNYIENDTYFELYLPAYDGWSDNYLQRAEEGYNTWPWWVDPSKRWEIYHIARANAQTWDWAGNDDAAEFLRHYLGNTGTKFEVDLEEAEGESLGIRQALDEGRNHVIELAKNSVWNGETTGFISRGAQGYNLIPFGYGIDNWQLALGKFDHFHEADFWVQDNDLHVRITSTLKDVYDFETFNPYNSLHHYGIAKKFPVEGTTTETFVEPLNF